MTEKSEIGSTGYLPYIFCVSCGHIVRWYRWMWCIHKDTKRTVGLIWKRFAGHARLTGIYSLPLFLSRFFILFSFLDSQKRPGIQKCKAQNCRYGFLRHAPDAAQYWIHFVNQRTLCVVQLYIYTYTHSYICLAVFVKFACRLSPVNHTTYIYYIYIYNSGTHKNTIYTFMYT